MYPMRLKTLPLWLAAGLGVASWMADAAFHAYVLGEGSFLEMMQGPSHQLFMRWFIVGLLFLTGLIVMQVLASRQQTIDDLRQREAHLELLFEGALDAIFVVDATGHLIQANPAAGKLLGRTAAEVLRLRLRDLDDSQKNVPLMKRLQDVKRDGPSRFETSLRSLTGRPTQVELSVSYQSTAEGQGQYVCFAHDISQRQQVEREREVTLRLVRLLGEAASGDYLLERVAALVEEISGCDEVGVQLAGTGRELVGKTGPFRCWRDQTLCPALSE